LTCYRHHDEEDDQVEYITLGTTKIVSVTRLGRQEFSLEEFFRRKREEDQRTTLTNVKKMLMTVRFLNHETSREAIRTNNGEKMVRFHKLHIPQLVNKNHHQYLQNFHRLLSLVGGCGSDYVRCCILHNSTVNIRPGFGHSLSLRLRTNS
jgi:hypothetical protein